MGIVFRLTNRLVGAVFLEYVSRNVNPIVRRAYSYTVLPAIFIDRMVLIQYCIILETKDVTFTVLRV